MGWSIEKGQITVAAPACTIRWPEPQGRVDRSHRIGRRAVRTRPLCHRPIDKRHSQDFVVGVRLELFDASVNVPLPVSK